MSLRRKHLNRLMPGLLASILVVLLMQLHAWAPLERMVQDRMMRWRGSMPWDSHIVMIKIDDKTLTELGQFPLSYEDYAQLIRLLQQEQVSVVVFNLLFSDSLFSDSAIASPTAVNSPTGVADLSESSSANALLAAAMAAQGRVVIGQGLSQDEEVIPPVPVLAETAIATGHLRLQTDADGATRWIDVTLGEARIPALGIAAAQVFGLEEGLVSLPSEMSQMRINWPGLAAELPALSFVDVLRGTFPADSLQGKIAIVGYGATAGKAQLRTPFDSKDPVVGGYMHAAVVHNLLQQNWLRLPADGSVVLMLLLGGAALGGLLYQRRMLTKIAISAALAMGWVLVCFAALHLSYLLPVVSPIMMVAFVSATVMLIGRLESSAMLQVRSTFLNTISHEIRTPLNAIVNLAHLLQETPLDDRQREFADSLHNSSQTLLALINDILDFSKIESERLAIEDYPVNLSEIVERSLEMLAPRAAEKGIELVYALTPQTPGVVMSDPIRLQQILINLLSNAVKFTDSGGISVEVEAVPRGPQNNWRSRLSDALRLDVLWLTQLKQRAAYRIMQSFRWQSKQQIRTGRAGVSARRQPFDLVAVERTNSFYEIRFAVRDTGIGIPSDQIGELFKPFSQASPSTARKYGGTGLGLAISQRLSERMGGRLWVKSLLGKGSTFYFTIKAHVAKAQPNLPEDLALLSGMRLLLIDRNSVRSDRLAWDLALFGIQLEQTSSLSAALAAIEDAVEISAVAEANRDDDSGWLPYDAVILDESMTAPGDGYNHSIDVLRRAAGSVTLPIILLSMLRNDVPNTSHTTVLWKPIKQSSLHQALRFLYASGPRSPYADLPSEHLLASDFRLDESPLSRRMLPGNQLLALPGVDPNSRLSLPLGDRPSPDLRILIAEDNLTNQRVALRLLELLDYRADVVTSGTAVLEAIARQSYDAILMDMRMPELDGIETTRRIRQMPEHQNIWIIAMTANAMAENKERCLKAGMNDYVSKPINRAALNQALERCLAVKATLSG